jgi:uncharacterized protein YciI
MSEDERTTMRAHIAYWTELTAEGRVLAFGPVEDEQGTYGLAIVVAHDRADAERLRDGDPAVRSSHGFTTELSAMARLVTPSATYDAAPG